MGSIYHNNNSYGKSIESPASDIILSSVMHIGGETQDNVEDAIVALSENSSGSNIEDLSDVNVDNPVEGDYLEYDGTANIWINKHDIKIVTWANGADEKIAAMLEAHYNGYIDIHDYWTVGDERTVSLSAMEATGVSESHVTQDVTMVLMNEGGKTLTTPIGEITECAFIVGQKNMLANGTTLEGGYMNSSNTNGGGWNNCARRTWCNSVYKNALPSTLVKIFKKHQNITANGSSSMTATSNDYFALPSEKEVFGSVTNANATAEENNTQFKYYETSSNRIKYAGETGGSAYEWWERSPYSGSSRFFCCVSGVGTVDVYGASVTRGLAPFGVI